jgi:ankyrin repeat protein
MQCTSLNWQVGHAGPPTHYHESVCLQSAAIVGDLATFKLILHHPGVDLHSFSNGGWTALHSAAKRGYVPLVRFLVEETALDIHARDSHGRTALDYAKEFGQGEVVRILVGHGCH